MNERIKELWENSDEIHIVYPRQGSPVYASSELLEKFAELIVRECALVIQKKVGPKSALDVLEHFGVEE